jgi:hypothetical protein
MKKKSHNVIVEISDTKSGNSHKVTNKILENSIIIDRLPTIQITQKLKTN